MFDWNNLHLFVAVARGGSSQAAAIETGLSQATISRRISALERQINLKLFTRDTTGFKLTANGRILLSQAKEITSGMVAFEEFAARLHRSLCGNIRMTASHIYTSQVMMPIIAAFRRTHPEIDVEMVTSNTFLDISKEGIDLSLRIGKRPDDPNLIARKVGNFGWGVYCSRHYADHFSPPTHKDELRHHDTQSFSGAFRTSDKIVWFDGLSDDKEPLSRCDTIAGVHAALKATHSVGPLAKMWASTDADLVLCFDFPEDLVQEAWLVTTPTARAAPHVQAFIEFAVPMIAAVANNSR